MHTWGVCYALAVATVARAANSHSLRLANPDGFVRALDFKHRLRVCNAYPFSASLDVYRGKTERLTGDSPMPYQSCRDFVSQLSAGDKLEFKVGDNSAGTFSVSDLPNNDAVLLLVIHRHDTLSTAVAFESHVFANLENAQVAVIDTYRGKASSKPRIFDIDSKKNLRSHSEELRFESVVAVNPGIYEVVLDGADGERAKSEFVAAGHESYVILRTGVEAQQGPSFPEALVVYPRSDRTLVKSYAARPTPAVMTFTLMMMVCLGVVLS